MSVVGQVVSKDPGLITATQLTCVTVSPRSGFSSYIVEKMVCLSVGLVYTGKEEKRVKSVLR